MKREPQLFQNCAKVYSAMLEQAAYDGKEDRTVWRGALVNYIDEIGVGRERYSYVMQALKMMGCVTQLRRGANKSPSEWELHKEPTMKDFAAALEGKQYTTAGVRSQTKEAIARRQMKDLHSRVETLEQLVLGSSE